MHRPLPIAKRPGHVDVIDFTTLRGSSDPWSSAAVMDLYSIKVLPLRVSAKEPDAAFARELLRSSFLRYGKPKWIPDLNAFAER